MVMSLDILVCQIVCDCCKYAFCFFFFIDAASTGIYTLSLHDALPIRACRRQSPAMTAAADTDPDASGRAPRDRKSTRLNSSHLGISYAVFCLKKKNERNLLDLIDPRVRQSSRAKHENENMRSDQHSRY